MPELDTRPKPHTCPPPTGLMVGILVMAVLMICAFVFSFFAWDRFSDIAADRIRLDIAVQELDRINGELKGQVDRLLLDQETMGPSPYFYIESNDETFNFNLHRIDPVTLEDRVIASWIRPNSSWSVLATPRYGYEGAFLASAYELGAQVPTLYKVSEASPNPEDWEMIELSGNRSWPTVSPDHRFVVSVTERTDSSSPDTLSVIDLAQDFLVTTSAHNESTYLYEGFPNGTPYIPFDFWSSPTCLMINTYEGVPDEEQADGLRYDFLDTQEFCFN